MKRLSLLLFVLLASPVSAQNLATIMPAPKMQFLSDTGVPLAAGKLYTYAAGTSTPQDTCTTSALLSSTACAMGTANTNPIILDSAGRATVYLLPQTYKFILQNSSGVQVWSQDNITATLGVGASAVALTGTFTYTAPTVLTLSANAITPSQNVHGIDTSGGAQNLNTINTSGVTTAFQLFLYPNNASGNPVTIKNGAGNITLVNGDFTMNNSGDWISLMLRGSTWYELARNSLPDPLITRSLSCGIRLSLTSGNPVTTADVTGAATVYAEPYGQQAGLCSFYDGTNWNTMRFSEFAIPLGTLTSTLPYDVFCYNSSGTFTCELVAWTSGTARATNITLQDGVYVKSGNTARRYIGTFYTTSTTQTEDSYAKRYLWNYYNRVRRPLRTALETTDNWNYTTANYRQANGNTANQLNLVVGVAETMIEATAYARYSNTGPSNPNYTSIGENSTTTPATGVLMSAALQQVNTQPMNNLATLRTYPAIGVNFYAWLEKGSGAGTTTWYGDNGAPTGEQYGITGWSEQ